MKFREVQQETIKKNGDVTTYVRYFDGSGTMHREQHRGRKAFDLPVDVKDFMILANEIETNEFEDRTWTTYRSIES